MFKLSHKLLLFVLVMITVLSFSVRQVFAQSSLVDQYVVGNVEEVVSQTKLPVGEEDFYTQVLKVRVNSISEPFQIEVGSTYEPIHSDQLLKKNDQVVVSWIQVSEGVSQESKPVLVDIYRLPALIWLVGGFAIIVAAMSGWRGVFSILGMFLSLAVLVGGVFPQIMAGANPLQASLMGAFVIATLTVYLSHGWSQKSHLALLSLAISLMAVALLSIASVNSTRLIGLGSEEAAFLKFGDTAKIDLKGLLLGGIILGALGVLDDIVISQLSVVEQLKKANSKLSKLDLYFRALEVGKDHIASLVNTLVLAYAGANLPLFLLFYTQASLPSWLVVNNQLIAEEIVRTIVGSIGLVLAVPITTVIAAMWLVPSDKSEPVGHSH